MVLVWGSPGLCGPMAEPTEGAASLGRFGHLWRVRTPVCVHALMWRWLHPASNWGTGVEPGRQRGAQGQPGLGVFPGGVP